MKYTITMKTLLPVLCIILLTVLINSGTVRSQMMFNQGMVDRRFMPFPNMQGRESGGMVDRRFMPFPNMQGRNMFGNGDPRSGMFPGMPNEGRGWFGDMDENEDDSGTFGGGHGGGPNDRSNSYDDKDDDIDYQHQQFTFTQWVKTILDMLGIAFNLTEDNPVERILGVIDFYGIVTGEDLG